MERVKLTTYDGIELAANLYLPAAGGAWASGVIVYHGFASRKENYERFGQRAADAGFAALIPDLRGHGESGGKLDANLFNDVAAALAYMHTRPEVNPMNIAIRGTSLGGWLALHTAAHIVDLSPVVAIAPTNESLLLVLLDEVSMVQRGHSSPMISGPLPRVNVNSMLQLANRLDVGQAARRLSPRPLLLIQCEEDDNVPPYVSERIYSEALEPKSLWLLPGCDHHFAQHDFETDFRTLDWLHSSHHASGPLSASDLAPEQ